MAYTPIGIHPSITLSSQRFEGSFRAGAALKLQGTEFRHCQFMQMGPPKVSVLYLQSFWYCGHLL